MKSFLTITGLSAVLLTFGLFVASQVSEAQQQKKNLASALLELPAPPPVNPQVENNFKPRADGFYSRGKTPADDAPITDLIEYWQRMNNVDRGFKYVPAMSDRVAERLLAEIEKEPELAYRLLNSLSEKPETASAVKKLYDKQIAETDGGDEDSDDARPSAVLKKWLTYNTDYFSDELLREARKSSETSEYVTNQEEVLALARVDWDKARPLLERMIDNNAQPVSQTLARWAFYKHAIAANDSSDAEKYRELLKATVENKNAKPGERDLAMDALVETGDFAGRDDWYYSLLADESLYDLRVNGRNFTGLTTLVNHSAPEKYVAKMLELLKSDSKNVRSAAVINLTTMLDEKNERVVRALLPWLEHPDWARETNGQRRTLIAALTNFTMPESVPGLIAVLNEKVMLQAGDGVDGNFSGMSGTITNRPMSGGAMSNRAMTNQSSTAYAGTVEYFQYRSAAVSALAIQKDARAVAALRQILQQTQDYERIGIIAALLACGGFTVPEQVEALEAVGEMTGKISEAYEARKAAIDALSDNADVDVPNFPAPSAEVLASRGIAITENYAALMGALNSGDVKFNLGRLLINKTDAGDDLVAAVARRIDELDAKNPQLAQALRGVLEHWEGAAVNAVLLRDLKNGKGNAGAVVKLLSVRRDLRDKQSNDVFDLRGVGEANPMATGVAACLLEDVNEYDRILAGAANAKEKIALLACARLIRARLPVPTIAAFLRAGDKSLALAAERFLESEDSTEARRAVLSMHPNEAKILGATTAFKVGDGIASEDAAGFLPALFASIGDEPQTALPYYMLFLNPNDVTTMEKRLQKEVRENERLIGVYAYDKNFVRIYDDKAVFSWEEDAARYRERALDAAEFSRLKSLLAQYRADELPPFLSACDGCQSNELLMLGRAGGRRVFYRTQRAPEFFAELDKTFAELREPPARLRYWLEQSVSGLEVLFADDKLQARAVWKNAADLRVLIDDQAERKRIDRELSKLERFDEEKEDYDYEKGEAIQQKRRDMREYENFAWRKLEPVAAGENRLGDSTAQPPNLDFIPARDAVAAAQPSDEQWKARTAAGAEIRAGETDGLFKVSRGQAAKIRGGNYGAPVITPDGRWAIAAKYDEEDGDKLVRVNLLNGKESTVKLPDDLHFEATAFIPQINRFLLAGGNYDDYSDAAAMAFKKFFLLDAETGLVSPAKGEMRPLAQQTFRPLQPLSSGADEFWAAIPDAGKNETQIGVFNAKTLVFKSRLTVPRIKFDSMNLWADERENKIYFVYQGHLLALPLPKMAN